jgi:hypothetical protein
MARIRRLAWGWSGALEGHYAAFARSGVNRITMTSFMVRSQHGMRWGRGLIDQAFFEVFEHAGPRPCRATHHEESGPQGHGVREREIADKTSGVLGSHAGPR